MSRSAAAAVSTVVGALLGVGLLIALERPTSPEQIAEVAAVATERASTPASGEEADGSDADAGPLPVAEPVRVVIPAIDVDADLVAVGLNPDRSMEVPDFGEAGWYEPGPRPGEPGPAVIAAHVDSVDGPDVFHRLTDLAPGDRIAVVHGDGSRSVFVMRDSEQQLKGELPVERIWRRTEEPVLRLITCGGDFDASRRSYRSNVIVYADAVGR